MLLDWVPSFTSSLPANVPLPPEFKFPPRPKPPSMTADPVVVFVDWVVSSTSNLPAKTPLPPEFKFFSKPNPPSTIRAPLSLLVLSDVPSILTFSPTFKFLTTPRPPAIWTAPDVVLVDCVTSFKVVTPSTSSVLFKLTILPIVLPMNVILFFNIYPLL